MARKGTYAKGVAKREEILDTALDVIARTGYSSATVKELATAVGLTQMGLLYYFGTKEALFAEIVRRRDERDSAEFDHGGLPAAGGPQDLGAELAKLVKHNADVPGLVQLYNSLTAEAATPRHESHEYFTQRYQQVAVRMSVVLEQMQKDGSLRADIDPRMIIAMSSALIDGLQTQWLFDPTLDMARHVEFFWETIDLAYGTRRDQ
ncbi:TetR/AcrR family transcriptional regulator [Microbacterium sp. X-17]|uniref:TetR/AcrR family transcriptional regulator n=1 Tax=Microbacterium sp. X-17 TaxID=3144404 RepID=UPI0031F5B553